MSTTQAQPAIPHDASTGSTEPAESLDARFKAWRAVVKNLEEYLRQLVKVHESSAKDHHKLAKVLDVPFKQTGHFEQNGVQDIFATLQTTTMRWGADQEAYAKSVHSALVNQASALEDEISSFEKRLKKDGVKGAKGISKIHSDTQKHIEALGKHNAVFETSPRSVKPDSDPYLVKRTILNKLSSQVSEENAHRQTILALQKQCSEFEVKIVRSIQAIVAEICRQHTAEGQDYQSASNSLLSATNQIAPDHEWNAFVARDRTLLSSSSPKRELNHIVFAGSDHPATSPVIDGDLLRKGTMIKKYNPGYFVLTKAGFLHEFKSKSIEHDAEPTWSLDIKDATIGAHSTQVNGKNKFVVAGKTKGLLSSKHEYAFQATSYDEMMTWWTALCKFAANAPTPEKAEIMDDSDTEVVSPTTLSHPAVQHPATATIPEHVSQHVVAPGPAQLSAESQVPTQQFSQTAIHPAADQPSSGLPRY